MLKAYKYKLNPNKKQRQLLSSDAGHLPRVVQHGARTASWSTYRSVRTEEATDSVKAEFPE